MDNPYHLSPTLIRPYYPKSGERIRRLGYEYLSPFYLIASSLPKQASQKAFDFYKSVFNNLHPFTAAIIQIMD